MLPEILSGGLPHDKPVDHHRTGNSEQRKRAIPRITDWVTHRARGPISEVALLQNFSLIPPRTRIYRERSIMPQGAEARLRNFVQSACL